MMRGAVFFFCLLPMSSSFASEALGPTYPVIEPDMLVMMKKHSKEQQEETRSRIKIQEKRLRAWREAPRGQRLPETKVEVERHFDVALPGAVLPHDFYRAWLMIDGDRAVHLTLAHAFIEENPAAHRVVLVNGNVKAAQEALKTRVWFDQGGALTRRLKVATVPARITFQKTGITVRAVLATSENSKPQSKEPSK